MLKRQIETTIFVATPMKGSDPPRTQKTNGLGSGSGHREISQAKCDRYMSERLFQALEQDLMAKRSAPRLNHQLAALSVDIASLANGRYASLHTSYL